MSAETPRVLVSPFGEPRVGRVVDEAWEPRYNAQDRDMVTVDVDGTRLRVEADELEEL
jgi:hypothetical protein